MAVKISDEFVKEQKPWVKRAMKGRPLYFGLQAQAAKKGKFMLSKKPGEVKPAKVKDLAPYEGDGKDKTKADAKNKVPGGASMGVAQGENGTLKLYFERGKAAPVAEKFVKFFITREMKFKLVKKVQIAEVDALPTVPDEDEGDNQQATSESVLARIKELAKRSKAAGGDKYGLPDELTAAATLAKSNLGKADDDLDDIEFRISTLERAKELQEQLKSTLSEPGVEKGPAASIAKRIEQALALVKSGDGDKADDELDTAEQSLANLRKAAGLPEAGTETPTTTETPKVDDAQAASFFNDWLEGIKPDLKTLKDAKAAELKEIGEHVKAVNAAVKKKDWKAAADAYKKADALITAAVKQARASAATSTIEQSTTEFLAAWKKATAQFRSSLGEVETELTRLADALIETDDEDLFWVASEGLPDLLREIRAAANGVLQIKASTPGRTAANARPIFRELRSVMRDERVSACDDNEFGVSSGIRNRISSSLDTLENTLDGVR